MSSTPIGDEWREYRMTTQSMEEFLVQGVQKLYYTEQQLVDALETLAEQTENDAAREAFSEHREETQQQVDRLERVFEAIGEEPETMTDAVVDTLVEEHEQFAGENDGEVLDRYNVSVGQKTEHYEIAAYGNLTSLAGELGYEDAADLLEESLREEEDALDELSQVGERFDQQQISADD
jgi:ferritin-like metal-binding protein YciE